VLTGPSKKLEAISDGMVEGYLPGTYANVAGFTFFKVFALKWTFPVE
jgi:hypothetical protein